MNPFEGATLFGYNLSIPNIGPVAGHEFAYTAGYVVGATTGVVVQIGIGILSGRAIDSRGATAGVTRFLLRNYLVVKNITRIKFEQTA